MSGNTIGLWGQIANQLRVDPFAANRALLDKEPDAGNQPDDPCYLSTCHQLAVLYPGLFAALSSAADDPAFAWVFCPEVGLAGTAELATQADLRALPNGTIQAVAHNWERLDRGLPIIRLICAPADGAQPWLEWRLEIWMPDCGPVVLHPSGQHVWPSELDFREQHLFIDALHVTSGTLSASLQRADHVRDEEVHDTVVGSQGLSLDFISGIAAMFVLAAAMVVPPYLAWRLGRALIQRQRRRR